MLDIKEKSINAIKWESVGRIINPLIFFAANIFLARLLTPDNFGEFAIINIIIVTLVGLLDFGLGIVLMQKKDIEEIHFSSVFWLSITSSFVISIIIFFFSEEISFLLFDKSDLKDYIKLTPICIILGVYINNKMFRLKREISFGEINIALIISNFISYFAAIILAYNNFGTWCLIFQLVILYISQAIILLIITKTKIKIIFSLEAIRDLWKMGKIMFLGNGLDIIFTNIDSLIIGKIFTKTDLGYYNRSKSLNFLVTNFTSGILSFILPAFSKMQDDIQKQKDAFNYVFNGLATLVFLIIGILYLCAEDVILIVYGEQWIDTIDYFRILIIGSYAYPISVLLVNIIISTGNYKVFIKNELIKKGLVTMALIIGFKYGIIGFLYAAIISSFIGTSINAYFVYKILGIKFKTFYFQILKYFFSTVILVIFFNFGNNYISDNIWIHLVTISIVFSLLYIFLLFVFRAYGLQVFKIEIKNQVSKYVHKRKN